jgi:hypothetical protein
MKNICLPSFFFTNKLGRQMLFFCFFTMIEYTKMIIFGRLSKEQKTFFYLRKKKDQSLFC